MTRTEPERLGWEHSGVERDVGRVRRWALPVHVVQACRTVLSAQAAADALVYADVWRREMPPWDDSAPRIPRAGMMSVVWAHRPSPDWGLP